MILIYYNKICKGYFNRQCSIVMLKIFVQIYLCLQPQPVCVCPIQIDLSIIALTVLNVLRVSSVQPVSVCPIQIDLSVIALNVVNVLRVNSAQLDLTNLRNEIFKTEVNVYIWLALIVHFNTCENNKNDRNNRTCLYVFVYDGVEIFRVTGKCDNNRNNTAKMRMTFRGDHIKISVQVIIS